LVISGLSIYAVSEDNDTDPDRDDTVDKGIKKINDMGVFSVTAVTSIFAYIWMFICLIDQNIKIFEAWITFLFFFVFIGAAYAADRYKAKSEEKQKMLDGEDPKDALVHVDFSAIELYRELVKEKQGEKAVNE
jgi:high-affinity Fe2+/Pb2+ permease